MTAPGTRLHKPLTRRLQSDGADWLKYKLLFFWSLDGIFIFDGFKQFLLWGLLPWPKYRLFFYCIFVPMFSAIKYLQQFGCSDVWGGRQLVDWPVYIHHSSNQMFLRYQLWHDSFAMRCRDCEVRIFLVSIIRQKCKYSVKIRCTSHLHVGQPFHPGLFHVRR
jgi:hypothetical protein